MKIVLLALSWICCVLIMLTGFVSMTQSFYGGLSLVVMGLFLLPPFRQKLYQLTNISLSTKQRSLAMLACFFAFGYFSVAAIEEEKRQKDIHLAQEQERKLLEVQEQNAAYFNANREAVLAEAEGYLAERNYSSIVAMSNKYVTVKDVSFRGLVKQAQQKLAAQEVQRQKEEKEKQRLARIDELRTKLRSIPASDAEKNRALYQELTSLDPDNSLYQDKFNHYSTMVNQALAKAQAEEAEHKRMHEERVAKYGRKPQQSAWDGSYSVVERYLKRVANDPDSIELDGCTEVYITDSGWLIGCDYRGRNGFGGMVRQSNWFTVVHNAVVAVHDSDKYAP